MAAEAAVGHALAFGTWPGRQQPGQNRPAGDAWTQAVRAAYDAGFRHFDCAWKYGNEKAVGEALTQLPRAEILVAGKLWWTHWDTPEEACRASLADLGVSYFDVYYLHSPCTGAPEAQRPMHELWRDMERLVDLGLVRALGVSNFPGGLLNDLLTYAKHKPVFHQIEVHPYFPNAELTAFSQARGMVVLGYCPLALGLLKDPVVAGVAAEAGATPAQVLLRWQIQRGVVPVSKSLRPERAAENCAAARVPPLTDAQMARLNGLSKQDLGLAHKVCNHMTQYNVALYS